MEYGEAGEREEEAVVERRKPPFPIQEGPFSGLGPPKHYYRHQTEH
jgi:hypothetical protein